MEWSRRIGSNVLVVLCQVGSGSVRRDFGIGETDSRETKSLGQDLIVSASVRFCPLVSASVRRNLGIAAEPSLA